MTNLINDVTNIRILRKVIAEQMAVLSTEARLARENAQQDRKKAHDRYHRTLAERSYVLNGGSEGELG